MKLLYLWPRMILACVSLALSACTTPYVAKKPDASVAQLPKSPDSFVTVPVTVAISRIQAIADGAIQSDFHADTYNVNIGGGADKGGLSFGYDVRRGPLAVRADSGALRVETSLTYWIDARGRKRLAVILGKEVWSPLIYASCGTKGEPRQTANVRVAFSANPKADWMLDVSNTPVDVAPTSQCCVVLPFCALNATPKVVEAMKNVLNNKIGDFMQQIRASTFFRDGAATAWSAAGSPIAIADSVWLQINPVSATLSPVEILPDRIRATASFASRPMLHVGKAPDPDIKPLPVATIATLPSGGFFLQVPADADFEFISSQLAKAVSQGVIRMENGSNYIEAKKSKLESYGNVATLHVYFEGKVSFWQKFTLDAYLTGKPRLDPITSQLEIPDLEFTAETKDLLVKIADWIKHDTIRDELRKQAAFDLSKQVGQVRTLVSVGMNQTVGPVKFSGSLSDLRLLGVYSIPEERKMRTYLEAVGQLSAEVQ